MCVCFHYVCVCNFTMYVCNFTIYVCVHYVCVCNFTVTIAQRFHCIHERNCVGGGDSLEQFHLKTMYNNSVIHRIDQILKCYIS